MIKYYPIIPMAKPRMTHSDAIVMRKLANHQRLPPKYASRAKILSTWMAYKTEVQLRGVDIPECNYHIIFVMPMPVTWSKRRKNEMRGRPHRGFKDQVRKNDKDNLEKALLDAVFVEDSNIWDSRVTKVWWDDGGILVAPIGTIPMKIPMDVHAWVTESGG